MSTSRIAISQHPYKYNFNVNKQYSYNRMLIVLDVNKPYNNNLSCQQAT